jgi:hypothetical protein
MPRVLPDILQAAGHDVSLDEQKRALAAVSSDAGSRQNNREYEYWTWEQIWRVRFGRTLRAMARSFGYEIEDGL